MHDEHEALGADARATVMSLAAGACREEVRAEHPPALERCGRLGSA